MLPLNREDKVPTNIGIKIEIINELLFLIFMMMPHKNLISNDMTESIKYTHSHVNCEKNKPAR